MSDYGPLSTVVAGRQFGRYWGKSRHRRIGSKMTRLTHNVTFERNFGAAQHGQPATVILGTCAPRYQR